MTQAIFQARCVDAAGEEVCFNLIAADAREALGIFDSHCRETWISEGEIEAARAAGEPIQVEISRIFQTGLSPRSLPSRIIPWEETARITLEFLGLDIPEDEADLQP